MIQSKTLHILLGAFALLLSAHPALPGRIKPVPTKCWHLSLEQVKIRNTCVYESTSWAGGWTGSLLWEDGVKTKLSGGLQGRGWLLCRNAEDIAVDGVCGSVYYRDVATFTRLADSDAQSRLDSGPKGSQSVARCIQLPRSSVCWLHPY